MTGGLSIEKSATSAATSTPMQQVMADLADGFTQARKSSISFGQRLSLSARLDRQLLDHIQRETDRIESGLRAKIGRCVNGREPWPLVVTGPAGCGKTCAALCLADRVPSAVYWLVSELRDRLIRVRDGIEESADGLHWRRVTQQTVWQDWSDSPLAILDEIGRRQKASDFEREIMQKALDTRYGQPLVVISNLQLDELDSIYDSRITSRLSAGTLVVFDNAAQDRRLTSSA